MSTVVLNEYNITPKENVVLLTLGRITRFKRNYGVTAQGIANVAAGRVGGAVGSTRRALNVLGEMGYVDYFQIGRTKAWQLTDMGVRYITNTEDKVLHAQLLAKPSSMFDED